MTQRVEAAATYFSGPSSMFLVDRKIDAAAYVDRAFPRPP